MKPLFLKLYQAQNETDLQKVIDSIDLFQDQSNWYPLGANENNFGTIENQQASAIGASIEKFTNSIDATLMKKCYEAGIDPRSNTAPKTMQEAVELFYGDKHQWLSNEFKRKESLAIQVVADGPKRDTSLTIYDDGEGQDPKEFENTFLSIGKGNKNDILFVQGKYNMGGTGSIVFCGKNRYQLIASKKYDGSGEFGFTLIRKHPFSEHDKLTKKNTWYEYLKIDGKIPSFPIESLDLGLHQREFITGSIIKLYSYELPKGTKTVISKELKERVDEYLFEPALPILFVDTKTRYPNDHALQRVSFGLKKRLEKDDGKYKYIEEYFTKEHQSSKIGDMKITSYVFKPKIGDKSVKDSRNTIRNEFFRSKMYVVFTMNGQVQGHLTNEFITRSLKFPLLKEHLLVHVDCTNMEYDFRSQLFMASRDRLKEGEEYRYLREVLTHELKDSQLARLHKNRKDATSLDSADTSELIKSFTKNLPLNNDLLKLLNNTFEIERDDNQKKKKEKSKKNKKQQDKEEFTPQRFPSFFKFKGSKDGVNAIKIEKGKSKTIQFSTDVENHYFDRDDDSGELKISLVDVKDNETDGGDTKGTPKDISEIFDVSKSSPEDGKIKISLKATDTMEIGDEVQIKIDLSSPEGDLEELIWIEIEKPHKEQPKQEKEENQKIGLPELALVAEKPTDKNILSWNDLDENGIATIDYKDILYIMDDGEKLEKIYINLDSNVLKTHKSKLNSNELREKAEKEYIAKVYFHTLFLYSINKNSKYRISKENESEIDINEYLQSIFANQYTSFLINFNMNELIDSIEF